ncbi:hypothetical protein HC928_13925, partial [bacterium]|nr:hypothetical protein [bacterium]
MDVTGQEPPGVYNGPGGLRRVNLGVITQPTPAEEWDGRIVDVTIRAGDTFLCIQGESPTDAEYAPFTSDGGGNAEGASGVLVGATFSIPVAQQPPQPTPVPPQPTPVPPQLTPVPPQPTTQPPGPTTQPPGPTTQPPGPATQPPPVGTGVPPLPPVVVVDGQPIIVKTVSTPFALPGDVVVWTISVTNPTDLPLPDVA